MNGLQFENFIAELLSKQDFKHITLTERYDLGIDIIAEKEYITYGIQIKRQSSPIGVTAIRQVVSALNYYDCSRAMIITNSVLTKTAVKLARSNQCIVIDRGRLIVWMNK